MSDMTTSYIGNLFKLSLSVHITVPFKQLLSFSENCSLLLYLSSLTFERKSHSVVWVCLQFTVHYSIEAGFIHIAILLPVFYE